MWYGKSPAFLRLLCYLRWIAVAGQAATVAVVTGPMQVALDPEPLWGGVAALALFNVYASWRTFRAAGAQARETFVHMLVDILVLTWQVMHSGGMENPFSSLFLLPIALAILALPTSLMWGIAAASGAGYGVSAVFGQGLPHIHGVLGDAFSLHKAGMLANFAVSAAVILFFFTRMAAARRHSELEVERLREQFSRNEAILALATQAASIAHELNTPLGTLTLLVDDLIADADTDERAERYATLKALLDVCRDRVRELAVPADPNGGGSPALMNLERIIERWQLIRPTIELHRSGSIVGFEAVDASVGHLLQALLDNAADASKEAGSARVDLELLADGRGLRARIRDYGMGFDEARPLLPATRFGSSKPQGLGIGLVLSHATVERLGGELSMQGAQGCGAQIEFYLPAKAAR